MSRSSGFLSALAVAMLSLSLAASVNAADPGDDNGIAWTGIRKDSFGQRTIADAKGLVILEAPERAEDAAVVPITVRIAGPFANTVKSLTLIVDENPAPIVGTFTYGPAAGTGERILSTRIRVDRYSFIRAVAETTDGDLYMTRVFVKASGGCSAPASRDLEEAKKSLGKMRVRSTAAKGPMPVLGEVMLRHPNISGLAIDQLSGGYPPARYISHLSVTANGKLVFSMEGGISISEDPHFRFTYQSSGNDTLDVAAEDSDGEKFVGHSGNPS